MNFLLSSEKLRVFIFSNDISRWRRWIVESIKKLQNNFWSIVCIFLQMQVFLFLTYYACLTAFYSGKCLHHRIWSSEPSMYIIYCTTIFTESDRDCIMGHSITALACENQSFSCYIHLMDESLILECIDDTVECCEIHTTISFSYKLFFEIWKGNSLVFTKSFNEPLSLFRDTSIWHKGC